MFHTMSLERETPVRVELRALLRQNSLGYVLNDLVWATA